ncbi:MAG: hypothetical protein FWG71_08980 [Synergistaceae bacterium]|nr:hypothetical protein [Synergistaceae bacterium]
MENMENKKTEVGERELESAAGGVVFERCNFLPARPLDAIQEGQYFAIRCIGGDLCRAGTSEQCRCYGSHNCRGSRHAAVQRGDLYYLTPAGPATHSAKGPYSA